MKIRHIDLPALADLPQTVCNECNKSKINGLFTPLELASGRPRCRLCVGELSERSRKGGWRPTKQDKPHCWNTGTKKGTLPCSPDSSSTSSS